MGIRVTAERRRQWFCETRQMMVRDVDQLENRVTAHGLKLKRSACDGDFVATGARASGDDGTSYGSHWSIKKICKSLIPGGRPDSGAIAPSYNWIESRLEAACIRRIRTMARESDYVPISCSDYELLEIACMDRYDIRLATHDGHTIVGTAVDLAVRPPEEFLVVRHDNGTSQDVRADRIRHMTVLSRPRRFDDHTFATPHAE